MLITSEDVNILRSHGGDASDFIFNVSQPWLSYWASYTVFPDLKSNSHYLEP